MSKPVTPDKPHAWEPPDSRTCAICGVDIDDHPEPDYDFGPLSIPGKVIARGHIVWDDQAKDRDG
jgi:hypothetical protein